MSAAAVVRAEVTAAPALDHDAMMKDRYGHDLGTRGRLERAIVWNLCAHLAANGWHVVGVDDGDEFTKTADAKAAMELIFNLDEAWPEFRKGKRAHRVFLVMGEGDTMVTDWGYSSGDPDGFNTVMEAFDSEHIAAALLGGAK